jgi:hypothetical protein
MHGRHVGALGGFLLALGCAVGVDNPTATTFGPAPVSGPASATSDEESDDDPFPDPDPIDTSTGWADAASFDDGTTVGDDATAGDDATTGDDSTTGEPTGDCPNLATCQGATGLGLVSGDQGSQMLETSGSEPTWITFRVVETDDSLIGAALSFTATLTSPAGANFDLYVYRGIEGGNTGCNGIMQQSTNAGAQDVVAMSWGEGLVPNGLDDSAWVAVEIRAKNDMCAPPQQWTLVVRGNT